MVPLLLAVLGTSIPLTLGQGAASAPPSGIYPGFAEPYAVAGAQSFQTSPPKVRVYAFLFFLLLTKCSILVHGSMVVADGLMPWRKPRHLCVN